MAGVWVALRCPSPGHTSYNAMDMSIAVLAPLFAGAAFVALRKADQVVKTHPLIIVNYFAMFTVILSLPLDIFLGKWGTVVNPVIFSSEGVCEDISIGDSEGLRHPDFLGRGGLTAANFTLKHWVLIVVISISAFASQFLLTVGLQMERAAPASVVMLIGIPATFLLQHAFVRCDPITWQSFLGGCLLMLSIASVGFQKFSAHRNNKAGGNPQHDHASSNPMAKRTNVGYTSISRA
eukprot:CAMPEP_0184506778 /NCGR_PEP_ID=MMETSP0113_2-20130426/53675_1 /TAXON_ID=91329 /ORGANISM="Norrisiella sphaerica, Strain BC52" /LENGTH=235 /DNA_ID=CAMNT_0026896505 /DNA_START=481 /DNA_END=1188 /DNA_ORIENTATION=-